MLIALNVLVLIGLIIIGWLLKSYIPNYLAKKAENLATKEDFNILLELEKETTREIESIKGKISEDVWIDQRHWDLKRETYSKLLEAFNELRRTTAHVADSCSPEFDSAFKERNKDFYNKQNQRQIELIEETGRLVAVAALIIDEKVINAIEEYRLESTKLQHEEDSYKCMIMLHKSVESVYGLLLKEARQDLLGDSNKKE